MTTALPTRLFVLVAMILAFSSPALAKKRRPRKKAKLVRSLVLPLQVKGLDRDTAKRVGQTFGKTLVGELKSLGLFKLLMGKKVSRSLKRLKKKKILVKGCHTKRRCIRSIGKNFKAKILFHMQVAKAKDGITLTVRALDVRSGKALRKAVEFTNGETEDVKRAALWAGRKVASPMISTLLKGKGRLKVSCSEGGADLYLNGRSFGKRTNKSFKVGAGVFDIKVKKDGFEPFHDVVVVRPKQEMVVTAKLKSLGGDAAALVAAVKPGDGVKPPEGKPDKKPAKDLPAWAIFEKPKPKGDSPAGTGQSKAPEKIETAGVSTLVKKQPDSKPFVPSDDPMDQSIEKIGDDDESRWYGAWWFWTVVGVAVVGGTGGGLYAAGVFDPGGGSTETGAALLSWQ
jgi:hypothetical protein